MPAKRAKAAQTEEPKEIQLLGGVSPEQILGTVVPGQQASDVKVNPPELFSTDSVTKGVPKGLYPVGAELFTYVVKSTGDTIWFPMGFEQPDVVWLWEQYEKPTHVQIWEWMRLAKVPKPMQRKAVELMRDNLDECLDLFDKWFAAMRGGATLGE